MVEPEAGILRLATELRQMIYDSIIIANADRTIKVTLDEHDKLHFENCELIMNLVCADTIFRQEVPAYLFQRFTFVLTDSERTCYPIVAAFSKALSPKNLVCVRKVVIPFFTIRGLFDRVYFNLINKNPYVLRNKHPNDDTYFTLTQRIVLRQDLCSALTILNSMSALENLELGVDIIEIFWYVLSDGFRFPSSIWFYELLGEFKLSERLPLNNPLSVALHSIRGMGRLRQVELKLKWSNFAYDSYMQAGHPFPPQWTQAVKEEMEALFEELLQHEPWAR